MSEVFFFIGCELVAIGGITKMLSPVHTSRAWGLLGYPTSIGFVRVLGFGEFVSALSAAVIGGFFLPLIMGGWYAVFFLVTYRLYRSSNEVPCGCFGTLSTPTSLRHVSMNLFFLIICFISIDTGGLAEAMKSSRLNAILYLFIILTGAVLSFFFATITSNKLKIPKNSQ